MGRIRLLGLLAAVALVAVLPASRADAALYWGSGSSLAAANADGSMLIDSYPYGAANLPPDGTVVGVAVNGTHLYWGDNSSGSIGAMALPGTPDGRALIGEPVWMNGSLVPNVARPWGVAVDSSHLYWASTAGAIGRSNLDGSAADRTFITGVKSPCGVAVDGAHIYWGETETETIGRARLDGTEVEPEFIAEAGFACGVAVNASHIYWANTDGTIGRAEIDGDNPNRAFIPLAGSACGVAVDAAHVYWANFSEPGTFVSRANLDGSAPMRFIGVPHYAAMCGVALDARVFQSRPPAASLPIRFGQLKRRKEGRLLELPVFAPERGELVLTSPRKLGWSLDKGPTPPPWRGGSFTWKLKLWPGKGRVGKRIRRQLQNHRRAPVTLHFNWAQQGHTPVAASKRLAFK